MPKASVVSVGTTPTLLTPTPDANQGYSSVAVQPQSGIVYVGGAGVSAADGFPVTGAFTLDLDNQEQLYGVAASGTVTVNVLQTGIG